MNSYKKIFKSQNLRFKILKFLSFIPTPMMLKIQYRIKLKRKLDLRNPIRFTEKLQWYKINYRHELLTQCADKYKVREFVESVGEKDILTKIYGVYLKPEEINFNKLPDKFIIKTTNGCGTNFICEDKKKLDYDEVKKELGLWLKQNLYLAGREWSYKNIEPLIIIEELLEDTNNEFEGLNDYKFFCFDGEIKYIGLHVDRSIAHKRNIYDTEWNFVNVASNHPNIDKEVEKPQNLDEMMRTVERLSKGFPFVRVDLYSVNNKIYFGEMTFYPWTGYVQFEPDQFDFELGSHFILPEKIL